MLHWRVLLQSWQEIASSEKRWLPNIASRKIAHANTIKTNKQTKKSKKQKQNKAKKNKLRILKGKKEDNTDWSIIAKGPEKHPVREEDRDQTMKILQIHRIVC